MVSSGGGSEKEDPSSVEPPKYFFYKYRERYWQTSVFGLRKWPMGCSNRWYRKTVGFSDPEHAVNEWNKINV
jgi:hypothetical protein